MTKTVALLGFLLLAIAVGLFVKAILPDPPEEE